MTKRQTESVALLVGGFQTFLRTYDHDCPFTRHGQLQYHVETIRSRRQLGSAKAALADETVLRALYWTLKGTCTHDNNSKGIVSWPQEERPRERLLVCTIDPTTGRLIDAQFTK